RRVLVPAPQEAQGHSLVPLLREDEDRIFGDPDHDGAYWDPLRRALSSGVQPPASRQRGSDSRGGDTLWFQETRDRERGGDSRERHPARSRGGEGDGRAAEALQDKRAGIETMRGSTENRNQEGGRRPRQDRIRKVLERLRQVR